MIYGYCMDKLDWSYYSRKLDGHNNALAILVNGYLIYFNHSKPA